MSIYLTLWVLFDSIVTIHRSNYGRIWILGSEYCCYCCHWIWLFNVRRVKGNRLSKRGLVMGRKSAKIAAKKGAADKAKAAVYSRALKDVYASSKSGGADPDTNFLLKVAIDRCKKFNVPKDNIDRAIKKGQGGDGAGYVEINYEGYGPGGVAVFVEASTDNNTRTVGAVRSYFNKAGGSLGTDGCLEFVFEQKAIYTVPVDGVDEDEFTMAMIDAGAEDVENEDGMFKVSGPKDVYGAIQEKLQEISVTPEEASLVRLPLNFKTLDDEEMMKQFDKLIDSLQADDDILTVYHNLEGYEDEE